MAFEALGLEACELRICLKVAFSSKNAILREGWPGSEKRMVS